MIQTILGVMERRSLALRCWPLVGETGGGAAVVLVSPPHVGLTCDKRVGMMGLQLVLNLEMNPMA